MIPQKVSVKNMAAYISFLITGLYTDTLEYSQDMITEDSIWLGAYKGHLISGRAAITEAMEKKELVNKAVLGPIYTRVMPLGKKHCETFSEFACTWTTPGGKEITDLIRIQISLVKQEIWRIAVTNVHELKDAAVTPPLYALSAPQTPPSERKLLLREKGTDNSIFIQPSHIEWVENDSHYSTIHIDGKAITVGIELRDLLKQCEGVFIPCHASYLINPRMVTSIKRFSLTLASGVTLPIPEKRYTTVKKQLMAYIEKK